MLLYRLAKLMEEHTQLKKELQQPGHPEYDSLTRRKADMEEEMLSYGHGLGFTEQEPMDDYVFY